MRELNQRTSEVMSEVIDDGSPAFVTRYGRPVAMILPLPANIESYLLSSLVEMQLGGPQPEGAISLDDVVKLVGLDPDRVRLQAEVRDE
jgi:prevent-host-death family protein